MNKLILLADLGNTSITIAIAKANAITHCRRIKTDKQAAFKHYLSTLKKYAQNEKINLKKVETVVYCSVTPSIEKVFCLALKKLGLKNTYKTGSDLAYPINNCYKKPRQVGADRLVNAVAAHNIYPASNVLIIDFGTAITFDIVTKDNKYLGGIIMPGIRTSLAALSSRAELLPLIVLKKPQGLIGKDTETSIQNGIIYATVSACEGIIKRFKVKYGLSLKVIATGGDAKFFTSFIKGVNLVDEKLTLKGLSQIYKDNV
jgi:type III pantothenate kinase